MVPDPNPDPDVWSLTPTQTLMCGPSPNPKPHVWSLPPYAPTQSNQILNCPPPLQVWPLRLPTGKWALGQRRMENLMRVAGAAVASYVQVCGS